MSKPIPQTGTKAKSAATRYESRQPATVSAKWLVAAVCAAVSAAAVCAWGVLCLTFWQGSWQLLYHPAAPINRTPAALGLAFENVEFGSDDAGIPQLKGWWIAGPPGGQYTALFFHGANGNLGDAVDALGDLHSVGLSVLGFDYRGYGQSRFVRPTDSRWREDAESAIAYLTNTRHISATTLILVGTGLGANLALEVAANHPELAGVVVDELIPSPTEAIFDDPRAKMVPARALVRDRWDSVKAASDLRIPSLWLNSQWSKGAEQPSTKPEIFDHVISPKRIIWLKAGDRQAKEYTDALSLWLQDFPARK